MGYTVIFGMLAASFIAIFLIPVTYFVVEKLGLKGGTGAHTSAGGSESGDGATQSGSSTGKEGEPHA
jgi:HAE1 family hydrophobic/amphiphilic exporter-1